MWFRGITQMREYGTSRPGGSIGGAAVDVDVDCLATTGASAQRTHCGLHAAAVTMKHDRQHLLFDANANSVGFVAGEKP
ncbi:hypothetical protein Mycsm_00916 [Mycobacterium sp. JS623]|nr:hypothetical protein Mycsm_00916 [Mycobacterium sp. JS623]